MTSSDSGNTPSVFPTTNAPVVMVDAPIDHSEGVARLLRKLTSDEAQASLQAAAVALLKPAALQPPESKELPSVFRTENRSEAPESWDDSAGPLVFTQSSDVGEVAQAFFQPWLPLSGRHPLARLFHRLNSVAAFGPAIFVAVGFAAAQLANNPALFTELLISDAHAAASALNVSPDVLRLYIQLGPFLIAGFAVVFTFFWSIFAASSKKPRVAALGAKIFSQVLTFMIGALTGFLAT